MKKLFKWVLYFFVLILFLAALERAGDAHGAIAMAIIVVGLMLHHWDGRAQKRHVELMIRLERLPESRKPFSGVDE